jgi:ribosomal protein S27E
MTLENNATGGTTIRRSENNLPPGILVSTQAKRIHVGFFNHFGATMKKGDAAKIQNNVQKILQAGSGNFGTGGGYFGQAQFVQTTKQQQQHALDYLKGQGAKLAKSIVGMRLSGDRKNPAYFARVYTYDNMGFIKPIKSNIGPGTTLSSVILEIVSAEQNLHDPIYIFPTVCNAYSGGQHEVRRQLVAAQARHVRCPKCGQTLIQPANAPQFRCPCGQMLAAPSGVGGGGSTNLSIVQNP